MQFAQVRLHLRYSKDVASRKCLVYDVYKFRQWYSMYTSRTFFVVSRRWWYMCQQVRERDLRDTFKHRIGFKTLLLRRRVCVWEREKGEGEGNDSHPPHERKLRQCADLPSPPIWRARREFVLERLLGNHPRWHLWYNLVTNETSLIRDARQINASLLVE